MNCTIINPEIKDRTKNNIVFKAQLAINELKDFYKRRKRLLWLCPILVLGISIGAIYWLPSQYKSSITILVQKDETLNPMVQYNMAVALASQDRLKSFNEIIYSRPTISMLIDSLGLADKKETDREALIKKVRKNINTRLNASDSFSIYYYSKDPVKAKKGVKILSNYFIKTKQKLENRRNNQTVDFFQNKLEELKKRVDKRQKELMSKIQQDVKNTPRESRGLQSDLDRMQNNLDDIEIKIRNTKSKLKTVKSVLNGKAGIKKLQQLDLSKVSSGDHLQSLVSQYKEVSSKYTSQYPEVKDLRQKVFDATEQLQSSLQSTLFDQQAQKSFLKKQYKKVADKVQQNTVAKKRTNQTKANADVYKKLYDDMKVKLEQAKTNRDLGKEAKNQFVVIEPPVVPKKPSKPNKILLLGGGLGLGIFLGLLVAAVAELLDTTIRRPEDIREFKKPVVAYISKGEA